MAIAPDVSKRTTDHFVWHALEHSGGQLGLRTAERSKNKKYLIRLACLQKRILG